MVDQRLDYDLDRYDGLSLAASRTFAQYRFQQALLVKCLCTLSYASNKYSLRYLANNIVLPTNSANLINSILAPSSISNFRNDNS